MRRTLYLALGMLLTIALHAQTNCNTDTFLRTFGGSTTTEVGLTLCASGDGNLYASGVQDNQTVLLKLSPAGDVLWSRSFTLTTLTPCVINEMSVDADGMLIAAAIETDTQPNATSLAFRYDPVANSMLWIKRFEGDSVFANGIIEKSPGGNYIFYQNTISLGTLSARAEVLELNRLTGAVVPTLARRYSLNNAAEFTRMVSYGGALYSIGTAQTLAIPIPSFRPLLTRFDSNNGQPVWSRLSYISTTPTDLIGMDLLIDNDTILSLTGGAFLGVGTPGPVHLYLQKNTLNGDLLWMKKYEIPAFTNEFGAEIVKLADGYAIYGTGERDSTFSQVLLKLDHNGNVLMAKTIGSTDQSALLPFLKGEAIAFDNHLFFSGASGASNTDWSILKTDLNLNLTDSCGYLQPLDSVTSEISPNPLNASTTLVTTQGAITTHDTTATVSNITLSTELLCPVCADTCNVTLDLGPDVVFCLDTIVTLDAGPGFVSYLWNGSITTSTFTFTLDSQSVTIVVAAVDSCGTTQRDTINYIFLDDIPLIADRNLCQGDSVTLNFPGFAGYQFLSDTALVFDSLGTIVLSPDTTTTYILYVSTVDGCAKTDTFLITVSTQVSSSDTLNACAGDFILVDSVAYTQDTTVVITLPSTTGGCDTVLTTVLTFSPQPIFSDTIVLCAGGSILFEGVTYTQDTTIIQDTLPASGSGCDTLLATTLVFEPLGTNADTMQFCQGDAINFNGILYSQDTTFVDTLFNVSFPNGCDSLITRTLVFNPHPTITNTQTACLGDSIVIDGITYTQDTTVVVDTLASTTGGCDTLINLNLVFTPGATLSDTLTGCIGNAIVIDSVSYTQDTTVVTTLPSTTGGCDTLVTYQLIFTPGLTSNNALSACIGNGITLGGVTYTQDTTITLTVPSTTGGCDTVLTTVLTFTPKPIFSDTIVLCAGGSILFEGVTYTQDTTIIQDTLPASGAGCDTLLTTTLVFEPLGTDADTMQLCQGDAINFNGILYSQDTTFVDTLFNVSFPNGCDSLITRTLIFDPRPMINDTVQACPGDSITFAGITYFQDTIVVDTLASTTSGCDTIATHTLVFAQPTLTDTIQFAQGDTVFVNGVPYTFPIIVVDTLPSTTGGCDTIATYVLQLQTPFTITCQPDVTVTAAPGEPSTIVDYNLPTVTTSCPGGFSTFTLISGLPQGALFPVGVTQVCIRVADNCGNVDSCCFNVTVLGG
ncbi:MAG: HYR domain-containing protein, partial [Saprospiraceae bacterium]